MLEEGETNLESELYALVNTILNAYEKFKKGIIKDNFFQKKVRTTINELVKFNISLDQRKINLSKLLKKMNFTQQYYTAINTINKMSALEFPDVLSEGESNQKSQDSKEISSTVLELPGITLEITSTFITLMDALKLKGFQEIELVDNLFKELSGNLKRFPGMDDLQEKVKKIHKNTSEKTHFIDKNNGIIEKTVDEIYQIFKEFQNKLNLKA
ncbi:MAG: hypothetical protein ACFFA0_06140 [Promethearchaeota archaeon]